MSQIPSPQGLSVWVSSLEQELSNRTNINNEINNYQTVLDIGTGKGRKLIDFGFIGKKVEGIEPSKTFNKVHLELGINSRVGFLEDINKQYDLVLLTHVFEHLTNLDPIFTLKNLINEKGYFFFEVPNCPFEKNFIKRPYDAPHLIFFTKKSWEKIAALISLNLINFSYASYSLDDAFICMSDSKKRFGNYEKGKTDYREVLKKIIPNFILNIRRKIIQANKSQNIDRSKYFINNIENSWCLRGIFQKNN